MEEQNEEEFEFALNEAAIYFSDDKLVVVFGDGRNAIMELESDEERALVKTVLSDVNFWHNFLSSLSAAVRKTIG